MADIKKLLESMNSIGGLHIGDPVVITGDVQHKGETGDVVGFNQDNSFVIVDLYNHGRKSFHSSDVSYNDYVDPDHDEDMYVPEDKFAGEKVGQKPGDQVRGTEKATKKKSGAHPFKGRLVGASESILKDLGNTLKDTEPKRNLAEEFEQFKEGYPTIAKQTMAEESNPADSLTLDVPLMIRLLEYAREDAKTDMDLHNVAERMIELSAEGRTLTMQDYDAICTSQEQVDEVGPKTELGGLPNRQQTATHKTTVDLKYRDEIIPAGSELRHDFKNCYCYLVNGKPQDLFTIDPEFVAPIQKQVGEAKGLKKRVRIVQGSYKGQTGTIGEVRHGLFKGAPKKYTIDLDGGGNVMLPGEALRLIKEPVAESDLFNPTNPMGFTNPYSPLNPVGVFKSVGPVTADDVKTLVQILTGTVGAAAAGIFAKHFVNTIRKTASAINQSTEANSRELLELQKHIAAMYRTLNKTKNEKTKEKYTKMLKDAHDALEEITTRMQMKASGTVGEQVVGTPPSTPAGTGTMASTGTAAPKPAAAQAQQTAQTLQQTSNLQKNIAQLKTAGVNVDPARAAQTLQKTDTGAPMTAQDKDTIAKMAPALGNVLGRPDLTQQLNTLIKKAGGGAQ